MRQKVDYTKNEQTKYFTGENFPNYGILAKGYLSHQSSNGLKGHTGHASFIYKLFWGKWCLRNEGEAKALFINSLSATINWNWQAKWIINCQWLLKLNQPDHSFRDEISPSIISLANLCFSKCGFDLATCTLYFYPSHTATSLYLHGCRTSFP